MQVICIHIYTHRCIRPQAHRWFQPGAWKAVPSSFWDFARRLVAEEQRARAAASSRQCTQHSVCEFANVCCCCCCCCWHGRDATEWKDAADLQDFSDIRSAAKGVYKTTNTDAFTSTKVQILTHLAELRAGRRSKHSNALQRKRKKEKEVTAYGLLLPL